MDATTAALLGSFIGGGVALAGTVSSNFVALKTASKDRASAVQAAYVDMLRERSGTVFAQFLVIVQEIEWITWYGDNDLSAIDRTCVRAYEERVNAGYGALLGAMAATASVNLSIYDEMAPILANLYDLENNTGKALRGIIKRKFAKRLAVSAIKDLRSCRIKAARMRELLPKELNRVMRLSELQGAPGTSTSSAMKTI